VAADHPGEGVGVAVQGAGDRVAVRALGEIVDLRAGGGELGEQAADGGPPATDRIAAGVSAEAADGRRGLVPGYGDVGSPRAG
jgi:hypothetical protein